MPVTYAYYTESYLQGREALLEEASFLYYERKAELILKERVLKMPTTYTDDINNCICELAESVKSNENTGSGTITSEKVGDYSVTYANKTASQVKATYNNIINQYLSHTGLLYTGI